MEETLKLEESRSHTVVLSSSLGLFFNTLLRECERLSVSRTDLVLELQMLVVVTKVQSD